jgi:EAL domain-containing protein (putative c-di-GMP-specific phosphodiesterase class I)
VQDGKLAAVEVGSQVTPTLVLRAADGQRILVPRAPFRIGRHGDNDLTLLLPELSSFHAELRLTDAAWQVVDMGSTNGTFVNGRQVSRPTALGTGDTLHLGSVPFDVSFASTLMPALPKTRELGAHETMRAAIELARVITKQHVVSHFQPLVALQHDDRVVGWEALARPGNQMDGGPAALLQLAEGHRQAGSLSEVFARSAAECALCRHCWPDNSEPPLLFLNFHPEQLIDGSLPTLLAQPPLSQLSQWYRLVVEIPEELACEANEMAGWIAQLRQGGSFVAYDDFGKGQSRIAELLSAPPDFIKLDRALVQDLGDQPTKRKLVQAVIEACQELHVQIIAEGIETEAEAQACRALGVDIGQGYLLGRPEPAYALFAAATEGLPESCQFRRLGLL